MSRVRLAYAVACFGILITTGGCSSSATAPEAVAAEASFSRVKGDSASAHNRPGNDVTLQSGYLEGGGRY